MLFVKQESDSDAVDPSVFMINDILQHHGEIQVRPKQERGVPGDILLNVPEDSMLGRLGGAGSEKLDAAEPQGGDAVVLLAFTSDSEIEENAGPRGRATIRRVVRGGKGRGIDGVAE